MNRRYLSTLLSWVSINATLSPSGGLARPLHTLPIWVSLMSQPRRQMNTEIVTPSGDVLTSPAQLCIVNEFNMKSLDSIYGPGGQTIVRNDHRVLIIPKDPPAPGLQTVSLSWQGRPKISWSFTVIAGSTLKKIETFRTMTTIFSTTGLSVGNHWVCVKAIARY